MAYRNVVRNAGCGYYAWSIYQIFVAAPGGSGAVSEVGCGEFEITGDKIASAAKFR
jgi:hypothetical protein